MMVAPDQKIHALVPASKGQPNHAAMKVTSALLNVRNAGEVENLLNLVSKVSPKGADAYSRVLELCREKEQRNTELKIAAWLHSPNLMGEDRAAIRALVKLFGVKLESTCEVSSTGYSIESPYADIQGEEPPVMDRTPVPRPQPHRGSIPQPGFRDESPSIVDTMMKGLPATLTAVIRKRGSDVLDKRFPLSKWTPLEKLGMGVADAPDLFVRLAVDSEAGSLGYCVHLSNEPYSSSNKHSPWLLSGHSKAPNHQYCPGVPNRAAYQLSHFLWRSLRLGSGTLEDTYARTASCVAEMARRCVVCGIQSPSNLRRSTTCGRSGCEVLFAAANFEIHLRDIWTNQPAVDLLLATMDATTTASQLDFIGLMPKFMKRGPNMLLGDCPIQDPIALYHMLSKLPPLTNIRSQIAHSIKREGANFRLENSIGELLRTKAQHSFAKTLIWACNSYGGFLTDATGPLRVPGPSNTPQFLLVNSSPHLEGRFAAKMTESRGRSVILFHGTTFDRLHRILRTGLRVCSGTPLMRHGASMGKGVYMSSNYHMSSIFSFDCVNDQRGTFETSRLGGSDSGRGAVMACEVAISRDQARQLPKNEIVIQDAACILPRYIFLPAGYLLAGGMSSFMTVPEEPHDQKLMIAAIERVLAKLRSGAW